MDHHQDLYILQSVDNALAMVELLCAHESMSLAELVDATGFGKSTVYRMLATLEKHKLIIRTANKKYKLGYKFASIGALVTSRSELVEVAHPWLQKLAAATSETVHLARLVDHSLIQFIDKIHGSFSVWMGSVIGMTRDAHLAATGKVLLAAQSDEDIREYVKKITFRALTPHTIVSPQALWQELERIRQAGYSFDNEESEIGLICIAAPIYDFRRQAVAAVSVSGFRDRLLPKKESFLQQVLATAQMIAAEIS